MDVHRSQDTAQRREQKDRHRSTVPRQDKKKQESASKG